MPIEKFIPLSPDRFIRSSKDFEVARFGHLNELIGCINAGCAGGAGIIIPGTGLNSSIRCGVDNIASGIFTASLGG